MPYAEDDAFLQDWEVCVFDFARAADNTLFFTLLTAELVSMLTAMQN